MNVYRVPISLDPLLISLGSMLLEESVPLNKKVETLGNLAADLAARDFSKDRPIPSAFARLKLPNLRALAQTLINRKSGFQVRGCHYCPAGGGLGWHTNSDAPGWRVYVIRPLVPPADVASKLLMDAGACDFEANPTHHCFWYDPPSWGFANVFEAGPQSWHAVDARTARMAVGLRVPREWALDLLRRTNRPGTDGPGNATTEA